MSESVELVFEEMQKPRGIEVAVLGQGVRAFRVYLRGGVELFIFKVNDDVWVVEDPALSAGRDWDPPTFMPTVYVFTYPDGVATYLKIRLGPEAAELVKRMLEGVTEK